MAWQARVNVITKLANDTQNVYVPVDFFDDAISDPNNPGNPLVQFQRTFAFPIGTSAADMQAAVIQEGKAARTCVNRTATLATAAPPGTLIAIN